ERSNIQGSLTASQIVPHQPHANCAIPEKARVTRAVLCGHQQKGNNMTDDLPLHFRVWLAIHPNRTKEWLLQKYDEGFQVVYIDGNGDANDPSNFALIEDDDLKKVRRAIPCGKK